MTGKWTWRAMERGTHRGFGYEIQAGDPRGYRRIVLDFNGASETFSRFKATARDVRAIIDDLIDITVGA